MSVEIVTYGGDALLYIGAIVTYGTADEEPPPEEETPPVLVWTPTADAAGVWGSASTSYGAWVASAAASPWYGSGVSGQFNFTDETQSGLTSALAL